ncbi:MAG: sulfotransferase [Solirubrobacterales bacterium]
MNKPQTVRIIAGFGRSGTTWVQDVLASSNGLRAVFEPLHPLLIRGANQYAHRYISANDDEQSLYRLLQRFIYEDYHSLWADYRVVKSQLSPKLQDFRNWRTLKDRLSLIVMAKNNVIRFRPQRRFEERIVKCIRANMMLSWLRNKFHARIVFVIRHPAAVVMSQMREARIWNPYDRLVAYRNDHKLLPNLDERSKALLSESLTDVEAHTLSWCIENSIGLAQAKECGGHVVFYERLLEYGEPEWRGILSALELQAMPDSRLISRPSQQAWGASATDSRLVRQYASWMSRIDNATSKEIQRILDATGTHLYSVSEALPQASL